MTVGGDVTSSASLVRIEKELFWVVFIGVI